MGSRDYLYNMASRLLSKSLAGLDQARTDNPPPDRVFVAFGDPEWDAECATGQLTVHYEVGNAVEPRPTPLGGRGAGGQCELYPIGHLVVTLLRCYPDITDTGAAPAAESYDATAQAFYADAWSLLTYLFAGKMAGSLFASTACQDVTFGALRVLNPEGQIAGFRLPVGVLLNDGGP